MNARPWILILAVALGVAGCGGTDEEGGQQQGGAPMGQEPVSGPWREVAQKALERGAAFLWSQAKDGRWVADPKYGPDIGVTGLAARAIAAAKGPGVDERLGPTFDWLAANQQGDGSIQDPRVGIDSYMTAAALQALVASRDAKYEPVIKKARDYLVAIQMDQGEGVQESSENFGGVGYTKPGKVDAPNMSTTQFTVEAVSEAGLPKDNAFYQRALKFLERSQNRSESNDQVHEVDGVKVVPANDGGGIYAPGSSKAGIAKAGEGPAHFRSYGSMTYALLKSYLLCDLDARDPRVQAALGWIGDHWELDYNPGMEHVEQPEARYMGLYYYYMTLGRCLEEAERQKVPLKDDDLKGWREHLTRALVKRQREDGSWVNHQDRWLEDNPSLATAYAMIAIESALAGAP